MKAVVYYRISTADKQDIAMQKKACMDYCNRESITIYKEYSDKGVSGAKESRPQFDLMLQGMRKGEFDTLIVYELSRIGRSLPHLVKLFEEFKKKNIKFISITQPMFDTTKPEGELFLYIMMALSQYERQNTIRRINDGLKEAKAKGKILGRPHGSKDTKRRKKGGYYNRYLKQSSP